MKKTSKMIEEMRKSSSAFQRLFLADDEIPVTKSSCLLFDMADLTSPRSDWGEADKQREYARLGRLISEKCAKFDSTFLRELADALDEIKGTTRQPDKLRAAIIIYQSFEKPPATRKEKLLRLEQNGVKIARLPNKTKDLDMKGNADLLRKVRKIERELGYPKLKPGKKPGAGTHKPL